MTMKTISKFLSTLLVAGSLVLGLAAPAQAQRGGHPAGFGHVRLSAHYIAPVPRLSHFYHPYVYPNVGTVIRKLPRHYFVFFWGPAQYYYCDGLFYEVAAGGSYEIAEPPVGAEVPTLPANAEVITIDGTLYYEYNGVYYQSVVKPDGKIAYVVAGKDGILNTHRPTDPGLPLVGDMTDQLPDGARSVILSSKTYWVTPDNVYLEEVRKDGKLRYRVVWVPEPKKSTSQPGIAKRL
jgi:hypothetical protein